MNEITLSVDNRHLMALLTFLKTLNYIEIKKVAKTAPISAPPNADKLAVLLSLYGAWSDKRSAESIIEDIETMRVFNRPVESL